MASLRDFHLESHPLMWFRNLLVYRLTQDVPFAAEALETALAAKPARPCATQELTTYGFVAPFGKGADARWYTKARASC